MPYAIVLQYGKYDLLKEAAVYPHTEEPREYKDVGEAVRRAVAIQQESAARVEQASQGGKTIQGPAVIRILEIASDGAKSLNEDDIAHARAALEAERPAQVRDGSFIAFSL